MSEEALNETKNSIYMPGQEYNGPGLITMENLGQSGSYGNPQQLQ
jgi:hypothetical protein